MLRSKPMLPDSTVNSQRRPELISNTLEFSDKTLKLTTLFIFAQIFIIMLEYTAKFAVLRVTYIERVTQRFDILFTSRCAKICRL